MATLLTLPVSVSTLFGSGAPSNSVGSDGGLYLDTVTNDLYVKSSGVWQPVAGGGGAVSSVNGFTGAVTLTRSDLTGTQDISTIDSAGDFGAILRLSSLGVLEAVPGFSTNTSTNVLTHSIAMAPNNVAGSYNVRSFQAQLEPLQNSPSEVYNSLDTYINVDPLSSGFSIGTGGEAVRVFTSTINAQGSGDLGGISFLTNNFTVGNGTDLIDLRGFSYAYGFGTVSAGVTINGPMQGYGFQPQINAASIMDAAAYTNVFYDFSVVNCASNSHRTFLSSPTIASITNNNNAVALDINPDITTFTGNANYTGIGLSGTFGTFGTGGWQGLSINPTITNTKSAVGVNVTMDSVGLYAGVAASLVIQDLTIIMSTPSSAGNSYTIEFTSGGTAGSEVASASGNNIQVQIESGVSTATQVKAALDGFGPFTLAATCTISGTPSNAQVTQAATNLAGGEDPGYKQAASFDGDVVISGSLSFGGALSVGQLSAYYSTPLINGTGNPLTAHGLITQPTVAANTTITNGDFIGLNTAMLLTMGDNAVVTSAFLGVAALGLPAVITMGSGSTIDTVSGGLFALSLDAGATGGTIDVLNLCNSMAIPNGTTTVNNLRGYAMSLPFGDPGTQTWGVYIEPTSAMNWMAGTLKVGGADTPVNSSALADFESTTGAVVLPRMTTTQRNALTAVNGMVIYNTTTDTFDGYAAGSWVVIG